MIGIFSSITFWGIAFLWAIIKLVVWGIKMIFKGIFYLFNFK